MQLVTLQKQSYLFIVLECVVRIMIFFAAVKIPVVVYVLYTVRFVVSYLLLIC